MSTLKIFQKGWNFNQDGPGNRLIYHLQGCNLQCPWCSNPEGIALQGTLMRRTKTSEPLLSCKEYTIDQIIHEAVTSRHLMFDDGGVTFTGGEPTVQFNTLFDVLTSLKEKGINTAIQTNGTHPKLPKLFPLLNTLMIDLKHYDTAKHKEWTDSGNETILENLKQATVSECTTWVRIPLIPGFNSDKKDIQGFIDTIRIIPGYEKLSFEFLAYHEYGKVKWEQCGMKYRPIVCYPNPQPPSPTSRGRGQGGRGNIGTISEFKKIFTANNIKIITT